MPPPPDGGPPLVLEILDLSQIGLHYGNSKALRVAYHVDDAGRRPIVGQPVRFSIFGDPAGSTLSADRALTDDGGIAQVTLTAGAAEATFNVTASAINAPNAEFQVAVSKLDFVGLRVKLAWDAAVTLRALLYNNMGCAELQPAPGAPAALRTLSKPGPSATLEFINLLSMSYALLARAEDASGHLLAQGCIDIPAVLIPAGSSVEVPLPLSAVAASALGVYQLDSRLTVAPAAAGAATQPWHALTACPYGLAQALLDATGELLSPSLQSAVAAVRGAPTGSPSCRPPTAGASSSLDADLEALLTTPMAPAGELASMVAELDLLVATAEITSTLTVADAGAGLLTADHALGTIRTGLPSPAPGFDASAFGLPIVDVKDVPIRYDAGTLTIGAHGFTLRLPALWQKSFEDGVIAPRFPALMPPSTRGWLGVSVGAVMHGAMTGCMGVEDLLCAKTGAAACTGNVAPACVTALDHVAAQLEAGFRVTPGIDFTLSGDCAAADSDGNLQLDTLTGGNWMTPLASAATFSGVRQ
jgi:hypothetical protein